MGYNDDRLNQIFDKTNGQCHICCRKLSWSNYRHVGARGAWEVEHSIPRSLGGTDHLNNLYPAAVGAVVGGMLGGPGLAAIGATIGGKLQYDVDPDW